MSWVSSATHRIEMMDKKHRNSAIALIVFIISMITYALDDYEYRWLDFMRTLQTMATVALLFAIFKRDALHKDKLVLFWLLISAIHCTAWVYCGFQQPRHYYHVTLLSIFSASCYWFAALIILYMVFLMYQEYVRLIQSPRDAPNTIPEVIETKEMPPPYMAPTSESSSVAILSPVINV